MFCFKSYLTVRFLSVSKFVKIEGSGQYALQVQLSLFSPRMMGKKFSCRQLKTFFWRSPRFSVKF